MPTSCCYQGVIHLVSSQESAISKVSDILRISICPSKQGYSRIASLTKTPYLTLLTMTLTSICMKNLFTLIFTFLAASAAFAVVRVVSNSPATIAPFTTIQAGIDASASGDTVYVVGSPNTYAGFTIANKKITVIGPGWAPDKNLPFQALVSGATISDTPAGGTPDGSELQGLVFTSIVQLSGTSAVNNLRIIRCQFNDQVSWNFSATGHLIEGCIFYSYVSFTSGNTYTNFLFQNNIFWHSSFLVNASPIQNLFNSVNVWFDHNLFYSSNNNGGGNYFTFSNSRFLTFSNNIFNQANPGSGTSSSTFTNNITNNASLNSANATANATPWAVNGNLGTGNIANQNPVMAGQAQVDAGNSSPLLDFTIASGPANNAGSDGKDLGLLYDATGSLNWAASRSSRLPRIFSMSITTPTVNPGSTISVTVEARKTN